jgi:ADP-ribosyltransferase exoenzyme
MSASRARVLRLNAELAFLGLARYSPDQPRDDHGRFGPGGGSATGSSSGGGLTSTRFDSKMARAAKGDKALSATKRSPPDQAAAAAMRNYTTNDYRAVNSALRDGKGQLPPETSYYTRQTVGGMDRALEGSTASRDLAVSRGVTDYQRMLDGHEPEAGTTWIDHGFVSTSTEDAAHLGGVFASSGDNPMRMSIYVPKGTPAISQGPGQRRDLLDPDEVVLGRGLTYRVVRDNGQDGDGIRQVDVEVVR